jgi:hypothetical protein
MDGMARDIAEFGSQGVMGWIFLLLVFGLPMAAIAAAICGRMLALLPLGVALLVFLAWWSYYAAPGPAGSGPGVAGAFLLAALFGWLLLLFAVLRPWRWRAWHWYRELLDPRPFLGGRDQSLP